MSKVVSINRPIPLAERQLLQKLLGRASVVIGLNAETLRARSLTTAGQWVDQRLKQRYEREILFSDVLIKAAADVWNNDPAAGFCLVAHIHNQARWSEKTFGPGERTAGVLDHIRKELNEVEAYPTDLTEWIDVVILALDGAWRSGHSPEDIVAGLIAKQAKNEARTWPDWRTADPGKAIEHVQEDE
jgi:hypothetical protein